MSAILYRYGSSWVLEARFPDSYHAWSREFSNARDARAHAKRYGIRVRRADRCDSLSD